MFIIKLIFIVLATHIALTHKSYDNFSSQTSVIPTDLFWGKVNGTNYLTISRNQNNLNYCSGSWAIAATTVLSDRFKVLRNASWPDYIISPQVPLSCISQVMGCYEEGDPAWVYDYISQNGITDETCAVFQARDWSNGLPCNPYTRCYVCLNQFLWVCDIPSRYYVYNIVGYAVVRGQDQMLSALQSGPIVCRVNSTDQFANYSSKDNILVPENSPANGTIYVEIVGYGVNASGTNYWIGRNSWGTGWGDFGFFNIIRGIDALGIEDYCVYPTPNLTVTLLTNNSQGIEERTFINNFDLPILENEVASSLKAKSVEGKVFAAVPSAWDWRNANGKNYLSWNRNQLIPFWSENSFAFAAASSISDRFNILYYNGTLTQFTISVQNVINNCNDLEVNLYPLLQGYGASDDTCLMYIGSYIIQNDCMVCVPPAPPSYDENSQCIGIKPPIWYKISSYKNLAGATKMMQEIYTNGPITCGIYSSAKFANYTGGIYSELSRPDIIDEYVSVVGWGIDPKSKTQYWIGRNSWGTAWGEYGFFRIQMFRDNLGIETDCVAAMPAFK